MAHRAALCLRITEMVPQNVDTTIGNLGLTNEQEDQLVAFLQTLTDGYEPRPSGSGKITAALVTGDPRSRPGPVW